MFRLVDLVELDLGQGQQKKTFRIELFEDGLKPNTFRARLWAIGTLSINTATGLGLTLRVNHTTSLGGNSGLTSEDKTLAEQSAFLPTPYASSFTSSDRKKAMDDIIRDFTALQAAIGV